MTAPLYAVSTGKIVLAEFDPEALRRYLARVTLAPVTPHTIRSKGRLKKEIQDIRTGGSPIPAKSSPWGSPPSPPRCGPAPRSTAPSIWRCRRPVSRRAGTSAIARHYAARPTSSRKKSAASCEAPRRVIARRAQHAEAIPPRRTVLRFARNGRRQAMRRAAERPPFGLHCAPVRCRCAAARNSAISSSSAAWRAQPSAVACQRWSSMVISMPRSIRKRAAS
jgi:Bacterial transcriptional regulator